MSRNRVHATEQQLAYFRRYKTRHGGVLRMIRMQAAPMEPDPVEPPAWHTLVSIVAQAVGVLIWLAVIILAIAGTVPPRMP